MSVRTYVYRIRPTSAQHAQMDRILRDQRILYNAALEERISAWKRGISISMNDQTKSLTAIRSFDPAYGEVPYDISKWTLKRLDVAMRSFFRRAKERARRAGFPRFRSAGSWCSFGFHQRDGLRLVQGRLRFGGGVTGALRLKMHRQIPADAVLKSAVFTKEGRHWRVGLVVALPCDQDHVGSDSAVGVDIGIESLATLSTGERIANVRPSAQWKRPLRLAARALARCKRGSKRRVKVRAKLAALQRKVRRVRNNHLHQVSARLAAEYGIIAVEHLKLDRMTRSARGTTASPGTNIRQKAGLNRALLDAAPGRFISMLRYKAEWAGGVMVEVDPSLTSQQCHACGEIVQKSLKERRHACDCGVDVHRDHNAAINILQRGLTALWAGRGPGDGNVGHWPVRGPGTADLVAA